MAIETLVVAADLQSRLGDADTLARYGGPEQVTNACEVATDLFRSAAIRVYTEASVDALTPSTITKETQYYLVSLALGVLSAGGMGRPAEIQQYEEKAQQWLRWLASGAVKLDGLVESGSGLTSGSIVRIAAPRELTFDRCNSSQGFNSRDPRI